MHLINLGGTVNSPMDTRVYYCNPMGCMKAIFYILFMVKGYCQKLALLSITLNDKCYASHSSNWGMSGSE